MSDTTSIILALVASLAMIALVTLYYRPRPRHDVRMEHVFRVAPRDLWDVVIPHPDRPNLLTEERYEWNEGSTTDADISSSGKVGARFSQRADPAAMRAEQTVIALDDGGEVAERVVWQITVEPAAEGARIVIERHYEKVGRPYPWYWIEYPQPTAAALRDWLHGPLTKSGALARYDAAHGTLPPQPSMRLWWMALTLGGVALVWYLAGPWVAIALLAGLVLHEAGHVAVMRAFGDRPGAVHLLPFAAGYAIDQMQHATAWKHAAKVLGGPIMGLGSAVAAMLFGWLLDSAYLTACGYAFVLINLAHLAPLPFLHQGRLAELALKPFLPDAALISAGCALLVVSVGLAYWQGYQAAALMAFAFVAACFRVPVPRPPQLPLARRHAAVLTILWLGLTATLVGVVLWLGGETGLRDHFLALMRGPFV